MNPYKSSIYSDIDCIKIFKKSIDKLSEKYKQYYSIALIEFKNNIIFNNETEVLYKDRFNKLNINLISTVKKHIVNSIKYITNLFDKYNIPKRMVLFNTFNFLYKEYNWIDKNEDLTVNYIVFDLSDILNYFLKRLILYQNMKKNWNGYMVSFIAKDLH